VKTRYLSRQNVASKALLGRTRRLPILIVVSGENPGRRTSIFQESFSFVSYFRLASFSCTEVLDDYLITLNVHWSKQEGRALIRLVILSIYFIVDHPGA